MTKTIQLHPLLDDELVPIRVKRKKLYYVSVNGKQSTLLLSKGKASQLARKNGTTIEVSEQSCIVRILPYVQADPDYCTHHWRIARGRGTCVICGDKKKFLGDYGTFVHCIFIHLLPCFDNDGRKLMRDGKPLYFMRYRMGESPVRNTNKFVTYEQANKMGSQWRDRSGNEYKRIAVNIMNAPYIVANPKKTWERGERVLSYKFMAFSQVYNLQDLGGGSLTDMGPVEVAGRCLLAVKQFRLAFGEPDIVFFNRRVHPMVVAKVEGGRYCEIGGDDFVCMITNTVVPKNKVKVGLIENRGRTG